MNILVRLLIALILGAVVAWVAGLILVHFWAILIGIVVGVLFFFSYNGSGGWNF